MNNIEKRIKDIKTISKTHNWKFLTYQENIGMLSFVKDEMRINVYVTKMTVGTCLNHPKHGKTQMFRKNVTPQELNKLFINPRQHTGKGYKRK